MSDIFIKYAGCWQEVRQRMLRCVIVWCVLWGGCFVIRDLLLRWCQWPLFRLHPTVLPVVSLSLVDGFCIAFELSLYFSFLLALPFFGYQVWCFVRPALLPRERLFLGILSSVAIGLFYVGLGVSWVVVLPLILRYALFFMPDGILCFLELRHYVTLFWSIGLYGGILLQLPIVILVLGQLGILRSTHFSYSRPYVLLGCFVLGMLATPPDMFAQIFFALPLYCLFELGYGLHCLCLLKGLFTTTQLPVSQ